MNNVSTTSCPKMVYFILVYRTVIAGKERTKYKLHHKRRHEFSVWTLVCVDEHVVCLKVFTWSIILLFFLQQLYLHVNQRYLAENRFLK